MAMQLIPIPGAQLEVADWGFGEAIVLVQTALGADELLPLAHQPALAGYRKLLYHRRGYAGSSPADGPGSVVRDATDCRALLTALGIERAHIVGYSYSGAIALQLAAAAPECVHSLILLEPPPVHAPSAPEFRAVNDRLIERRRAEGPEAALDEFLTLVIGRDWRRAVEEHVPGAAAQMQQDVATFFDADLPALLDWEFSVVAARRIGCPVLHIGGTESGQFFADVRDLILDWLPHAEDVMIQGADHTLALTHAPEVADALVAFVRRHAIGQ
jgi:pimeloyl-ACP methyl ester carboxylesterase